MIDKEIYPNTWLAFSKWFDREGWGADSIENLSERGWNAWFPDFLRDWGVNSAEECEKAVSLSRI